MSSFSGDKGHAAEMKAVLENLASGKGALIALDSLVATSRVTFAALESLSTGTPIGI